jgi:transcriptional regulator with XRE-family HTH domain
MATNEVLSGPTSKRVSENVERLRKDRGLSQAQLAQRLVEVGRPMRDTAVSKIERGTRRVDADDLVALALALNVSPLTILLPPAAGDAPVELTDTYQIGEWAAWQWGAGERTASDWRPGRIVRAAEPGENPAGDIEALEEEREFARRQDEYKALAKPETLRHRDSSRAVALAKDFASVLDTLVNPFRGASATALRVQYRTAKRFHAQLGIELEALGEQLDVPE